MSGGSENQSEAHVGMAAALYVSFTEIFQASYTKKLNDAGHSLDIARVNLWITEREYRRNLERGLITIAVRTQQLQRSSDTTTGSGRQSPLRSILNSLEARHRVEIQMKQQFERMVRLWANLVEHFKNCIRQLKA